MKPIGAITGAALAVLAREPERAFRKTHLRDLTSLETGMWVSTVLIEHVIWELGRRSYIRTISSRAYRISDLGQQCIADMAAAINELTEQKEAA